MIKTAMILGAGYGRRLLPLSLLRPKPMFPVLNRTMLEWWVEALTSAGVRRAVINVHHQAPRMLEQIKKMADCFSGRLELLSSPEEGLLGTGGGIKKAEAQLGRDDFLVVNADIFSDFDLVKVALKHMANPGRLATLGLLEQPRPQANVSVGQEGRIISFRSPEPVPGETARLTYSGVMALSPAVFPHLSDGPGDLIEALLGAMAGGGEVFGWTYEPILWTDMGTVEDYWRLNRDLAAGRAIVHSTARVSGTLAGWNVVGAEAVVEEGARVENCVLWPGAAVGKMAEASNAIIAGQVPAKANIDGGCFCVPDAD